MKNKNILLGMVFGSILLCAFTVAFVGAAVPDTPTLVTPENNSETQDLNVFLIVKVNDDDDEWLNTTFHNATNDEVFGYNKVNGTGKAACVWRDLAYGNEYSWYANSSDGADVTQSDSFNFTVLVATKSDIIEERYINPSEGLGWATVGNTTDILNMTVAPFLSTMGQWFYVVFVFSLSGLIFLKTQSAFLPSIILLLTGLTMATLLPDAIMGACVAMVSLGLSGVVYSLFHKRL